MSFWALLHYNDGLRLNSAALPSKPKQDILDHSPFPADRGTCFHPHPLRIGTYSGTDHLLENITPSVICSITDEACCNAAPPTNSYVSAVDDHRRILMGFFALLGTAIFLYHLLKLADLVWFYYLRPSGAYKRYQRGPQSYAIITGATDGIGKSLAKELYRKGFNVIVHGRNEEKLKATVEEIKALREDGTVESFIADATSSAVDFAGIAKRFDDLNITLLVNNVGGTYLEARR